MEINNTENDSNFEYDFNEQKLWLEDYYFYSFKTNHYYDNLKDIKIKFEDMEIYKNKQSINKHFHIDKLINVVNILNEKSFLFLKKITKELNIKIKPYRISYSLPNSENWKLFNPYKR